MRPRPAEALGQAALGQNDALGAFVAQASIEPPDYAGPALHARIIAMDAWCRDYDPYGQTDVEALFGAVGRQPLLPTNYGMRFDPVAFRELIAFIAEPPL